MTSPISSLARNYVRSRAETTMEYECTIVRMTPASYDETSLIASSGSATTIYTGVCRIWEINGAVAVNVGDTDVEIQSTQLSTPWDAPLARMNDEVLITGAPAWDTDMQGKRFQIQSSARAGELRATRRYNVTSVL